MDSKLKVLWIAPYPFELVNNNDGQKPAHSAPWITSLAEGLKDKVHLTIISFSRNIAANCSFNHNGIDFHFIKIPKPIIEFPLLFRGTLCAFQRFLKRKKLPLFDIIHIHGTEHQYATALKSLNATKIISIQGLISEYKAFNNSLNYTFFAWPFTSHFEVRELRENKNFICRTNWDSGIVKKYNAGATIHENWELLRPEFYCDAFDYTSNKLLFIGGLNTMKGINEFLGTFKELISVDNNFELVICGGGSKKQFTKLLNKHNLEHFSDKIDFVGKKNANELVSLFKTAFCLIHPTYIDNSPNSVCEAQVSGLPVIASNVGGVSSLIEHKNTGILVERYQSKEIAKAIIELKNNSILYNTISENSRKIARVRHDYDSIINKTLNIYQSILSENNAITKN